MKSPKQLALQLLIDIIDEVDLSKIIFQNSKTTKLPAPEKGRVLEAFDEIWNKLMDELELQKEVDSWPPLDTLKVKVIDARTGKEIPYGLPDNPTAR